MARAKVSARRRQEVARRAGYRCEYCHSPQEFSPTVFGVDHILPVSRGGGNDPENLAFACGGCNEAKHEAVSAPDPLTGEVAPLYHPRRDRWADHFAWSDAADELRGLTPTGRATVAGLGLNRAGVRNMRLLLRAAGQHPPEDTGAG